MFAKLFISFLVSIGPWVTDMGKDCFTVLWTSDSECQGWVQLEDGTRVYDEFAGRRTHGTFHRVRVTGLQAGTAVTYSIGEKALLDKSNPRRPKYGDESLMGPYTVTTFDPKKKTCRFSIVNDMHMNVERYSNLISKVDPETTDFIFLNGDIISAGHHPVDSLVKYEIGPLGDICSSVPVAFARGNHEGRGDGVRNVAAVFPKEGSGSLPFTYIFREGPVAFLVLDAGETHPKNCRSFCGKDVYEDYIYAQLKWAEEACRCRDWRTAKVRIVLSHVPSYNFNQPDDYVTITWMANHALPVLNKLGVNLMLNADLHEYFYWPAHTTGNDFPIIVNDNHCRVDVSVEGRKVDVSIYGEDGKMRHQPLLREL